MGYSLNLSKHPSTNRSSSRRARRHPRVVASLGSILCSRRLAVFTTATSNNKGYRSSDRREYQRQSQSVPPRASQGGASRGQQVARTPRDTSQYGGGSPTSERETGPNSAGESAHASRGNVPLGQPGKRRLVKGRVAGQQYQHGRPSGSSAPSGQQYTSGPGGNTSKGEKPREKDSLDGLLRDVGRVVGQCQLQMALDFMYRLAMLRRGSDYREWSEARRCVLEVAWNRGVALSVDCLGPQTVRKVLLSTTKLQVDDIDTIRKIADRATKVADRMNAFEASYTLWALQDRGIDRWSPASLVARFLSILEGANAVDCSNFVYACHKLGWNQQEDYLRVAKHFATLKGPKDPQQYSNILWATADRGTQLPPHVLGAFLEGFLEIGDSAIPQNISNVVIALQKWQQVNKTAELFVTLDNGTPGGISTVVQRLIDLLVSQGDEANTQQLSNVLWATSKQGWATKDQLQPLFVEFTGQIHQAVAQNCSNVLWAAGRVGYSDQRLLQACVTRFSEVSHTASPQNCSNSLLALAQLGVRSKSVVDIFTKRLCEIMHVANAQNCSNTLWALATLDIRDIKVMHECSRRLCEVIDTAIPQNCSNTLWALATMGIRDTRVIGACTDRIRDIIHVSSPQNCSNTLWALATLGIRDTKTVATCTERLCQILDSANAQACSNSVWALATLQIPNELACNALCSRLVQLLEVSNEQQCVNTVMALVRLGMAEQAPTARLLMERCLQLRGGITCKGCANLLYGAGKLGVSDTGVATKLLQILLHQQPGWNLIAVSQALLGLWYAGFSHLPEGAERLTEFVETNIGNCDDVGTCAAIISGLGGLVAPDDPTLKATVDRYAAIASTASDASRHSVATVLDKIGYGDKDLVNELRQ